MGHIGDRLGRKKVMVGTLLLMGISTFLVGCLPTYGQVGLLAPVLLVAAPAPAGPLRRRRAGRRELDVVRARPRRPARLLHQLHAQRHPGRPGARPGGLPAARRRAVRGPAARLGLADPVPAQRGRRRSSASSSAARSTRPRSSRPRPSSTTRCPGAPLGVLFRDHWRGVLRVFFAAFIAMVNTMFQVFALNFATSDDYGIGISSTTMLWLAIVANLVAIARSRSGPGSRTGSAASRSSSPALLGSAVLVTAFLGVDRRRQRPARLRHRRAAGRRRLQHAERGVAGDVRRVLPDQRPALRHGDRHPVRLRAGRVHARPSPVR